MSVFKKILLLTGLISIKVLKTVKTRSGSVTILLFHNIKENQWESFSELIHFINRKYKFISPEIFSEFLNGQYKLTGENFLITFDDGFKSSFNAAISILNPLGIKAAFFICPNFVNLRGEEARSFIKENLFEGTLDDLDVSDDQIPMEIDDLKKLIEAGHLIGNHTMNHRRLSRLQSEDERAVEIIDSKNKLQGMLGHYKVEWFAYPFGDFQSIDKSSLKIIMENFKFCFTGVRGTNHVKSKVSCLYRESIDLNLSFFENTFIGQGALSPFYFRKRKYLEALL